LQEARVTSSKIQKEASQPPDGTSGSWLVYTLPASTHGHNLTNITVSGGWQDDGRNAQEYTLSGFILYPMLSKSTAPASISCGSILSRP
jgi:hypothetical protein